MKSARSLEAPDLLGITLFSMPFVLAIDFVLPCGVMLQSRRLRQPRHANPILKGLSSLW